MPARPPRSRPDSHPARPNYKPPAGPARPSPSASAKPGSTTGPSGSAPASRSPANRSPANKPTAPVFRTSKRRFRNAPDAPARGIGSYASRKRTDTAPDRAPLALPDLKGLAPLAPPDSFLTQCADNGIAFDDGDLEKLSRFLSMLLAANDVLNLTAITEPEEAWRRHIFDSLTLLQLLAELPEGSRLIDVGTGGGLPGVPLAVCCPQLKFTLLESTGKKVTFLRAVVSALGLTNTTVIEGRAETTGHDRGERSGTGRVGGHRESYMIAMARAVGRLNTLAELTIPFVKIGGRAVLIKGQQAAEELTEAAKALHLLKAVHEGTIDTPTGKLVVLTKQSATPKDYPRRDGEPKRVPLGSTKEPEIRPVSKPTSKPGSNRRSEPPASAGGRRPPSRQPRR